MTKTAAKTAAVRHKQMQLLVEHELQRAEARIRAVDIFGALLVLVVGLLTYLGVLMLLDYSVHVPQFVRLVLFSLLAATGAGFAYFALVRPLLRQINPYFAARQLEKATPDAKNGLINWLDLRGQPMNQAIRESLQRHAVTTLEQTHVEEAIPTRRPMRLLFLSSLLVLMLIAIYFCLPAQFGSLFKRALLPFTNTAIPTHTRIELILPVADPVHPDPDHAETLIHEVAAGEPVPFAVRIHGVVPDDVFLEYQRTIEEQPLRRPFLRPRDEARLEDWKLTLSSDLIPADGLYFRVVAGDGRSRPYRLAVVSRKPPSVSDIDITLTYPPYTGRKPSRQAFAPVRALVGTSVQLSLTADQPVTEGRIEVLAEQQPDRRVAVLQRLKLIPAAGEDEAGKRRLVLANPWELTPALRIQGKYRIVLQSAEGKQGVSPDYPIDLELDAAPRVDILKVGEQTMALGQPNRIVLAANDVVPILGRVVDDVAAASVRLVLRTKDSPVELGLLDAKVQEQINQRASGYAPPPVDFQLTLDLTKVAARRPENGEAAPPRLTFKDGQVLELWVEALDTAEPKPNLGKSAVVEIEIKAELPPPERQQQEQKSKEEEKKAEQQKQQRQERENRDQPQDQQPEQKPEQKPGQGEDQKPEQKPGQGQDQKPEQKPGQGQDQKPEQKPGQGEDKKPDQKPGQGEDKKPEQKPGQGQDQKPEQKPGQGEDKKPEQKPGQGEDKKPDQKPGQGEDKKTEQKPGQGQDQKPEQKPGQGEDQKQQQAPGKGLNQKLDQKPAQDPKSEQKPGDGQDQKPGPGQDQKPEPKPGQGEDKKPEQKPGQGQDQKPEPKPGQGEDKKPEQKPGQGQDQKPEQKPGQGEDKKPDQKPGQGQDQKPEQKPGQGEDKKLEQKPGQGQDQKPEQKPGQGEDKKPEQKPGQGQDQKPEQKPGQGQDQEPKPGEGQPGEGEPKPGEGDPRKQAEQLVKAYQKNQEIPGGGGKLPGDTGDADSGNKEDAKRRDLLLDTLRQKLERGEIDKQLKKTLDDLNLTPQQAKQILDKAELARAESRGRASGPEQSSTRQRVGARTYTGTSFEPPAELEGSFRKFRQERAKVVNQPPPAPNAGGGPPPPAPPK